MTNITLLLQTIHEKAHVQWISHRITCGMTEKAIIQINQENSINNNKHNVVFQVLFHQRVRSPIVLGCYLLRTSTSL